MLVLVVGQQESSKAGRTDEQESDLIPVLTRFSSEVGSCDGLPSSWKNTRRFSSLSVEKILSKRTQIAKFSFNPDLESKTLFRPYIKIYQSCSQQ